jgi:hypothetical protein
MAGNNVLRWIDGRGWLVFSGGADTTGEIRGMALGRAFADGGIACVLTNSDVEAAERLLDDLEDLGGQAGYLVDLVSEDDQTIQARLAEAGFIVIGHVSNPDDLRSVLVGAAVDGMLTAFQNGAIILIEGRSISLFGAWMFHADGDPVSGLDWVNGAILLSGVTSVTASDEGQAALNAQPGAIAIGIGSGSAVAFGPNGEVETWGKSEVTVALGREFGA